MNSSWITKKVQNELKKLQKFFKNYLVSKNVVLLEGYKKQKSMCNKMIKKAKKLFQQQQSESLVTKDELNSFKFIRNEASLFRIKRVFHI